MIITKTNRAMIMVICSFAFASCTMKKEIIKTTILSHEKTNFNNELDNKIKKLFYIFPTIAGISIAIYTPNGIYTNGFGYADIKAKQKATSDSAFYIASSTKSMVALSLAILHERGEINLNDSIAKFASDAKFPQNIDTNKISLKDLLSQSSGILNEPIEFRQAYTGQYNLKQTWDLLAQTKANEQQTIGIFKYTNSNYNIISLLIEKKLKKNWKNILNDEIFQKAKMNRTTAYLSKANNENWSIAKPYISIGSNIPIPSYLQKNDSTMHSAGGVFMSANDAVKWLELLVENGKLNGEQIIPINAIKSTRENIVKVDETFGNYKRDYYGLGFYTGTYGETKRNFVHHMGSFSGYRSHISYMPEDKIGVAIFINDNQIGFLLADLIANYIYDNHLKDPKFEEKFDSEINKLSKKVDEQQIKAKIKSNEIKNLKSTLKLDLNKYIGDYENKEFGKFQGKQKNNILNFKIGNLKSIAQNSIKPETLRVELIPNKGELIEFKFDNNKQISGFEYSEIYFKKIK